MFLDSKETHSIKKESQCYKEILASANERTWLYAAKSFSVVRFMIGHSTAYCPKRLFSLEH